MPNITTTEREILEAALFGLEHLLKEVDGKIAELRGKLRGKSSASDTAGHERVLSSSARRRIALAQKKRWAAYRKSHKKVG